ncbi:MAG: lysine--tRNA ligase [Candidatus Gracilibacteria bacterium]|nr:lysine--tRNA ligase [Candidatus Gracilibacteria bacterium]
MRIDKMPNHLDSNSLEKKGNQNIINEETPQKIDDILNTSNNRLNIGNNLNWGEQVADLIISQYPNKDTYTLSAGISPSGIVHFGNFRDVMTSLSVLESLKQKGKKVRFIFSWDNFDRFRKVPKGVDESFKQYIGMPLTSVPDPLGELNSYAERYQKDFEESMKDLGIDLEFKYQTEEYKNGTYDELIKKAMDKRDEIAKILLGFMSEKAKTEKGIDEQEYIINFYPITIYSRFTNKDNTKILSIEGTNITYKCLETGKIDTIDYTKDRLVKLNWKVDWPMRWNYEGVIFEPGGKDHASPGGSYDVSSVISKKIFDNPSPYFVGYEFIGIQGIDGKMSGSAGNALSVKQLLEIYDPLLLKWLYLKKTPSQVFNLAFDSEIYRQYEEFDNFIKKVHKGEDLSEIDIKLSKDLGLDSIKDYNPIPFRQLVAFGQIAQWDEKKLKELLNKVGFNYDDNSIKSRLNKGKNWLEKYNKNESISLHEEINTKYIETMDKEQIHNIKLLFEGLNRNLTLDELNTLIYSIPKKEGLSQKENNKLQKTFFVDVYNLLIGKNSGPRLSTFIYMLDRKKVLNLLNIK